MKLNDKMNEMKKVVEMKDALKYYGYTYEDIITLAKYVEDNKT